MRIEENMRNKKGQMQLSFGMMFSILIIIVTLAVAFYVIREFVQTSSCSSIELYYDDLTREIDNVWRSSGAQLSFSHALPSSVDAVCFGNPAGLEQKNVAEKSALARFAGQEKNAFIVPVQCGIQASTRTLQHVKIEKAFCVKVVDEKVAFRLQKAGSTAREVSILP